MPRQLSTSVSDLALAVSVYYVVSCWIKQFNSFAAAGLAIQGLAATTGVIRFAMARPERTSVFKIHKFLSWLATAAGMALISYNFCLKYHSTTLGNIVLLFAGIVTLTSFFQTAKNKQLTTEASSGLSVLVILILSALNANWNGVSAALVYIVSGGVIRSEGELMGFQRVDILHYALVLGNLLFLIALP